MALAWRHGAMATWHSHSAWAGLAMFSTIFIVGCSAAPTPPPPSASAEPSAAATLPPGAYLVKPGDTVITVADALRVSQEELVAWNIANDPNIGSNPELHANDVLWVAGPPPGSSQLAGSAKLDPDTAKVAEAWTDGAWYVYQVALPPDTHALATLECCVAAGSQETSPSTAAGATLSVDPAVALIKAHLAWLAANPAPACLADGYAADAELGNAYLWWLSGWKPLGGAKTITGAAYLASLQVVDAHRGTFIKLNYLGDCA
jgi:murein DD-endopeptidase MepM/ murein hydrolase activator NlpD